MRGFCEDACEILVSLIEMCKVSKGFAVLAIVGRRICKLDALNFLLTTETEFYLTMEL